MTPRLAPSSAGSIRFFTRLFSCLFAIALALGFLPGSRAQVINPTNNFPPFNLHFHRDGSGFETKGYTLQGPTGGGPLFSGLRLTRAGDYSGLFFATRGQDVFKLDAEAGTFETVPLSRISPQLAEQGWPTALGFDPIRREILLTSLGGEGYIHTYSASSNQWRLLTSLNNWDVSDIALHGPTDTFYVVRNSYVSSPGQMAPLFVSRIARNGTHGSSISIGNLPFGVGFSDHEAELIPVGEYLVLLLEPGLGFHERNLPKESRIYLISPRTGQVTLTYRADWNPTPRNQLPSVSITAPSQGAVIEAGTSVKLTAIGTDVDGFVASMEFFVDGQSVGFGTPTINAAGMTFFELNWVATVGAHVITARATDHQGGSRISSGVAITVRVVEPVLPLVSVRTIDAEATEYPAVSQIPPDTAQFEITRERNLQSSFTVYFTLGGTATEHRDYVSPSNYVVFPAGVSSVRVTIVPMADVLTVVEPTETVILNIAPSPSGSYEVNANEQQATVVIFESGQPPSPSLVIVEPSNGSLFEPGEPIHILAAGTGFPLVSTVQFKADGQVIGSSTYIHPTPGGQTFAIEAEDFDYDGGKHVSVADVMPYMGGAYEGLSSRHNVDYFRRNDVSEGNIYRFEESPNVPMFASPEPTNSNRGTWEVTANYRIGWMDDGTWFNYTRNFPPGSYRVYAGLAHGDSNTTMRASLAKVTAGRGTQSQTLQTLGEFTGPATGNWTMTTRVPLTVNGQEVQVQLGGEETLRFQGLAGDFDYILLQSDNIAAPPRVIWHSFTWTNAPLGTHTITAETMLANGQVLVSSPVQIRVGREQPASFVRRDLPEHFQPELSFRVTLQANPPTGTHAYAVEDTPPVSWAVSSVSHDGVFDRATGKVKFGPFTDGQARTLTYSVRAPLNATGIAQFTGNASRNGVLYPITGDQTINGASEFHPADSNQNAAGALADKKITVNELTAYAAAWKSGQSWPVGPNPIPVSYVTRAAYIWKNGEAYRFEPGLAPPSCWVPLSQSNIVFQPRAASIITVSERIAPASIAPGASAEIKIKTTPIGGSVAHAVEEEVPAGWSVSNITHEGNYDAATRTIRWGVFMDANPRILSYTLVAPAGVASVANLGGETSFDGLNVGTAGTARVVASSDATAVSLSSTRTSSGGVQLKLTTAAGQSGIIEYSDDLVSWTELQTVIATTGSLEVSDVNPGHKARFYRFRID
ncbi:MAG TPA: Ig-like domain-containing protein [Verrucomicrobiae bacterium]